MNLKELSVKHPYQCATSSYAETDATFYYDNIGDFLAKFGNYDLDYSLVFRFDVHPNKKDGEYHANIFMMQQQIGRFQCAIIQKLTEDDSEKLVNWLRPRFEYMKSLWTPFV